MPNQIYLSYSRTNQDYLDLYVSSQKYFILQEQSTLFDSSYALLDTELFNIKNSNHTQFVKNATELFQNKKKKWHELCKYIAISGLLVLGTSAFCMIPLVGTLTTLATLAFFYSLLQYSAVKSEYNDALSLLQLTCHWSLGKQNSNQLDDLKNNADVRAMRNEVFPLLSEQELKALTDDSIDQHFVLEQKAKHMENQAEWLKDETAQKLPDIVKDNYSMLATMYRFFARCPYNDDPEKINVLGYSFESPFKTSPL